MAISLHESIKLGFLDFWSRKVRSFITLLGIILGTMSIIVILAIVSGINEMTLVWINETGGMKKVEVRRNWRYNNPQELPDYFTMREVEFIRDNIPEVEALNVTLTVWGTQMFYGSNYTMHFMNGTLPDAVKTMQWDVAEGRFINNIDYLESSDVIVIGSALRDELFGSRNPLGQYVTVNKKRLMVIGVMSHRQMDNPMFNDNPLDWMNRYSFVPISTVIHKLGSPERIEEIEIRTFHESQSLTLKPILEDLVLNLRKGQPVFRVNTAIEEANQGQETMNMVRIIFFFISAISLFVGGIVIMNIMLATVQERTREIGVRLAVGARQVDILIQFLVQTVVVTFIGGVIGVLLSVAVTGFVGDYVGFNARLEPSMIFVALGVSVIVGLFFGIYPAVKASKLDPVKALRVE
jgi:putative ABC transport system permease protein